MNISNQNPICLLGASPDTGNQGVTALCYSMLDGLSRRGLKQLEVFDHGRNKRRVNLSLNQRRVTFDRVGLIYGKRYYRPENLRQVQALAPLGGLWSESARTLTRSRAVLDVSGGDSFAEIYGRDRFRTITLPKQIALNARRPLILMPQTYGPFVTPAGRRTASAIVRRAAAAWARDVESFEELKRLLGPSFDAGRHRLGVDMAFSLPSSRPHRIGIRNQAWLDRNNRKHPLIGFNVSGLLFNDPDSAQSGFGLKSNYAETVQHIIEKLLKHSDARILLVPHVFVDRPGAECDLAACRSLKRLFAYSADQIDVLDGHYSADQLKWIIAQTDWFCGTRMHSTIAGLSSGVPTVALAYSMKTQGVFDTCGQHSSVVDLRTNQHHAVAEQVLSAWKQRIERKHGLSKQLPNVLDQARQQMDDIASMIGGLDSGKPATR